MPSSTGILTLEEIKILYNYSPGNTAYLTDIVRLIDSIMDRDASEDATIESLESDISALLLLIKANSNEILHLHRLLALLIFELIEQGIEVQSKELLTELKIYLKNGNRRL